MAIAACGTAAALLARRPGDHRRRGACWPAPTPSARSRPSRASTSSVVAMRWRDPGRYRPVRGTREPPRRRPPDPADRGPGRGLHRDPRGSQSSCSSRDARYLGFGVDARSALAGYAAYRRHLGLVADRADAPRGAAARRGPGIEVEFQTMLIPVNTAGGDPRPTWSRSQRSWPRSGGLRSRCSPSPRSRSTRRWTWRSTTSSATSSGSRRAAGRSASGTASASTRPTCARAIPPSRSSPRPPGATRR